MNLQTAAMRETEDKYVTAGQHKETKKWHGMEYANHKTPGGSDRYMLTLSDNRGYDTREEAVREFNIVLALLPSFNECMAQMKKNREKEEKDER